MEELDLFECLLCQPKQPERKVPLFLFLGFDIIVNKVDFEGLWQLFVDLLVHCLVVLVRNDLLSMIKHFSQVEAVDWCRVFAH